MPHTHTYGNYGSHKQGKSQSEHILSLFTRLQFPYQLQIHACSQDAWELAADNNRYGWEDSPAEGYGQSASCSCWPTKRYHSLLLASLLCSAVRSLQKDTASAISTSFLRQKGEKVRQTDQNDFFLLFLPCLTHFAKLCKTSTMGLRTQLTPHEVSTAQSHLCVNQKLSTWDFPGSQHLLPPVQLHP